MTTYEKNVINEIKKGNRLAFNKLFETYYEPLVKFSNIWLQNEYCAQEVVSDFFSELWNNRQNIKIHTNLAGYLYTSIKNRTLNKLKQKQQSSVDIKTLYDLPSSTLSPEEKFILEEEQKQIEDILLLIPERSRQIFIMHRFDKLKYKEIAELLGISVNTVEKHIIKALKILREYYRNLR
jgi:RNA polymerase sigma-70 factor (ECF subfamily)